VQGQPSAGEAPTTDLAGAYFEQLGERFELAADATGGAVDRELEIAGLRLRLRCAGERMQAALLPPFEHLAAGASAGAPQLTISLFDTASTGVAAPPPLWAPLPAEDGRRRRPPAGPALSS